MFPDRYQGFAMRERAEKLALVREQVESGSLVIRQMTEKDPAAARPAQPSRPGRR